MVEQILLSSGSFDRVREIGGFGQPLHTLYPQIQAVLVNELGADAANLLAEPVVDRAHDRIDWYTQGDPDRKPVAFSNLPEDQRQPILAQVQAQLQRGRELADRYAASGDPQRMQLGAMIKAALGSTVETDLFLVGDRPVLAHWGFATDRPWEMGGPMRRSPGPPPLPSETSPPDVAIPDIVLPEQASSATPPPLVAESPEHSEPPELPSESPSAKPAAAFADAATPPPLPSEPMASPETEAPAPLLLKPDSPVTMNHPSALLGYVVVGSRYFWGIALLAVLLALGTFLWVSTRTPTSLLMSGSAGKSPNVTSDASLNEAWRIEQELRAELEQQLIQLAEQRSGRCPLSAEAENAAAMPVIPMPDSDAVETAADPATHDGAPPALQPARTDTGFRQSVSSEDVATALESSNASKQEANASLEQQSPPSASSPALANAARPQDASRSPASVTPPKQALQESLTRTLEKDLGLQGSRTALSAPQPQPSVALPVQAEPTPEERQEFAKRLSATGAATGEITATLLWNSNADLDLVVYCPSGRMLDYQNPQACGGTLDVDANAARDSLSDRPVENVFWPAGQAEPGTYRIVVRYAPRKDEQRPQPTPFQIRLIRDRQEKVFKSTASPDQAAPVTDFTVER